MPRKLIIAIDCDDVLVPSTEQIVSMYNVQFGTNVTLKDAHTSGNPDWEASREETRERIYDIQFTTEFAKTAPFEDAITVCRELAKSHELHLVTARPNRVMPVTTAMLEKYFAGIFIEIEHLGLDTNKGEVCKRLGADMLIDDNLRHLESAQECGVENLIWFGDYPWNQAEQLPGGVVRCSNWQATLQEVRSIAER